MSIPALRQPKFITQNTKKDDNTKYVIVTLKNKKKLVVSSDSYHGVIGAGEGMYKCLYCKINIKHNCKEDHKNSSSHQKCLEKYPTKEEYAENLIRQLSMSSSFCIICSTSLENIHLSRHIQTEFHLGELQKAIIRASSYKPCF